MLAGCYSLANVPLFDTSSVTNMQSMFQYCHSLVSIPSFDMSLVTDVNYMLYNCYSLQVVYTLNVSNVTSFTYFLAYCRSLCAAVLSGAKYSISLANCKLARNEIVAIFTALGTAAGSQTITITGNHGIADLTAEDENIAIAKGWTVVA
jgi:surface protein